MPNWEECGPCLIFASYTQAVALQLRKKHGKNGTMKTECTEQNIHKNENT